MIVILVIFIMIATIFMFRIFYKAFFIKKEIQIINKVDIGMERVKREELMHSTCSKPKINEIMTNEGEIVNGNECININDGEFIVQDDDEGTTKGNDDEFIVEDDEETVK